jgi:hypothetical protein
MSDEGTNGDSLHCHVRQGWAVEITRKDKTTFLASAGCGTHPAVWCLSNRKLAVGHKRELRERGFSCRVVRVQYMDPTVLPNSMLDVTSPSGVKPTSARRDGVTAEGG